MKKITKAVIPAAGMGTRLLLATKSQPKEMIPIGNKPVIQYVVEEAAMAGIKQILIITGSKKRSIEDHFDSDNELNAILSKKGKKDSLKEINFMETKFKDVQIFYTRQREPLGLGHAIYISKDFFDSGENFALLLGDTIIHSENQKNFLKRLMDVHEKQNAIATIGIEEVDLDLVEKYGIIEPEEIIDSVFKIKSVVEKPKKQEAPSNLAINGRYIFNYKLFEELKDLKPGFGGEIQLTDAIQKLIIKEKNKIWGLGLKKGEIRYDIGNMLNYSCAFFDFCIRNKDIQSEFITYVKNTMKKMKLF